ncbi:hypothetical protein MAPG_07642 [Magnaporthiopsis poae ATCC 64411]|uniref:Uncharacterized protein n=1 Tax=Magnaporthiopsis poae (strain ATCC 64411 / 73-15) TaxID=644358 RepID=A0A0C4E577_MAGP6|nr:hypothetical protein MAPG_07642 [Magnaporthiopsis poae ATCC 64411]
MSTTQLEERRRHRVSAPTRSPQPPNPARRATARGSRMKFWPALRQQPRTHVLPATCDSKLLLELGSRAGACPSLLPPVSSLRLADLEEVPGRGQRQCTPATNTAVPLPALQFPNAARFCARRFGYRTLTNLSTARARARNGPMTD